VSVLPEPVGAATSVERWALSSGQAQTWASVGVADAKWRVNQLATAGWNGAKAPGGVLLMGPFYAAREGFAGGWVLLRVWIPAEIATAGLGLLALVVSFCNRYRGVSLGLYFLFSLTPVRGGTYFLCCAKERRFTPLPPKCRPQRPFR
jgi:hypothetical protein